MHTNYISFVYRFTNSIAHILPIFIYICAVFVLCAYRVYIVSLAWNGFYIFIFGYHCQRCVAINMHLILWKLVVSLFFSFFSPSVRYRFHSYFLFYFGSNSYSHSSSSWIQNRIRKIVHLYEVISIYYTFWWSF